MTAPADKELDDLVRRLRSRTAIISGEPDCTCRDAADAITALRAEREEAHRELDERMGWD